MSALDRMSTSFLIRCELEHAATLGVHAVLHGQCAERVLLVGCVAREILQQGLVQLVVTPVQGQEVL